MTQGIGERVHARLLAEGGFCWLQRCDRGDVVTVHFNKGCVDSAELRALLKRHASDLKAFVIARAEDDERERERLGYPTPGIGSPESREAALVQKKRPGGQSD